MSHTQEQNSEPHLDFIFCEECGSCEMEYGKKFTLCIGCRTAYYCSWQCESADLLDHHPVCREFRRLDPDTSPLEVQVLVSLAAPFAGGCRLTERKSTMPSCCAVGQQTSIRFIISKTEWRDQIGAEISGPYRCFLAAASRMFCKVGLVGERKVIQRLKDGSLLDGTPIDWCPTNLEQYLPATSCILREENLHVKVSLPHNVWVVLMEMIAFWAWAELREDILSSHEPPSPIATPLVGTSLRPEAAIEKAGRISQWVKTALTDATCERATLPGVSVFRVRKASRVAIVCTVRRLGIRAGDEMLKLLL